MAPSSPSSSDRVGIEPGQTGAGSIREVSGRLLLWAKREGGSLAQVEYVSEFARRKVEQRLRDELIAAGVLISTIDLPARRPATEIVEYLLAELVRVPSGVVFIAGFATAFESQVPLKDSLRIVNFNREALIAFPLRQVWWMTPVVVQKSLHAMPDLHGWFSPKLRLSEPVENAHSNDFSALEQVNLLGVKSAGNTDSPVGSLDDARQRSQRLLTQFASAKAVGAEDMALLTTYLLPALEALADVGAQKELRDLTLQFEGLLGSLKLSKSPEVATGLSRLAGLYLNQGRYSEAEPLYLRALQLRKAELGDRHPSTATSLNNLALLYESQGRYGEAEPLYVQALEIRKAELGDHHSYAANSLFNLALLYHNTQRHQQALSHIQQAVEIYLSVLGSDHPTTQAAMSWLKTIQQAPSESQSLWSMMLMRVMSILRITPDENA